MWHSVGPSSAVCAEWPGRLRPAPQGPHHSLRLGFGGKGREGSRGPPPERLAQHGRRPGSSEGRRPLPRRDSISQRAPRPRRRGRAGKGRWRRPCRPWLLRAACCGLRRGAPPACYRRGPPSCREVSTAAGGGSPALAPSPVRSRTKGERAPGCWSTP